MEDVDRFRALADEATETYRAARDEHDAAVVKLHEAVRHGAPPMSLTVCCDVLRVAQKNLDRARLDKAMAESVVLAALDCYWHEHPAVA